ncbi:hypothetical protein [Nocardia cyriacigeorgica]|uniref:hypothetical protein n=1 Tax=Nocardia cyriacigeorgica TaxID=135487 RepID=UPI0018961251|nr:hypothetical protein [Nocardia cyriacigeorgica]MBF6286701.1 hypothetical protein [Nocardia cyriacigeorgica]
MTETGTVQVDHHQFLLTTADADTTAVTAEGTLIWTGPGFVTILTGIAHGPATLTVDTSATHHDVDEWETVEETVIDADSDLLVISLDGNVTSGYPPIPPGRYRVRAHARGRDSHWDLDVTEPTENYLLHLTPTTEPVRAITRLRKTDTAYNPPAKQIPVIDYDHVYVSGPGGTTIKVRHDSPEAQAVYAQRDQWAGRLPTGRIAANRDLYLVASTLADLDRDLVDDIDALTDERQHALARWCARRAFERAGLTVFDDFRAALDAMDNNTAPPADFANFSLAWHRLETDPGIPLTVEPGFGGRPEFMPQYTALTTYMYAVSDLEPVRTAFEAVRSCIGTYGQHYPDLMLRIRAEFLATAEQ